MKSSVFLLNNVNGISWYERRLSAKNDIIHQRLEELAECILEKEQRIAERYTKNCVSPL